MKKIVLILCALLFCALLVGCSCSNETGHTHIWNEGKVLKAATVSEYGTMIYSCMGCDEMKSTMIPKLEHEHIYEGEWVTNRMAHWHACGVENCTILGDKGFHTWDGGVIIKEADQNTTGKKLFTCTECGYKKEDDYRALPTVEAEGWEKAMEADRFTNVTFYYTVKENGTVVETLSVEIDGGSIKYTEDNTVTYDLDVAGARLGSFAIANLLSSYKDAFNSFTYDSSTRAYLCELDGTRVALQFSDGNVSYISITNINTVTVLSLSKYGRTEVGAR